MTINMKNKFHFNYLFACIFVISCIPEKPEYPELGDWFEPALPHKIAMHDGDANNGTFEFFEFIHASMVDKGVSYDRFMSFLMTYPPPGLGMEGKWTIFVLNNSNVRDMSAAYFNGQRNIRTAASTTVRRRQIFKLIQFYYIVGEVRSKDFPAKLVMDNGFEVTVSGNTLIGSDGNTVNFLAKDIEARNGIFHVIDGPLHPTNPANFVYRDASYFYTYGANNPDKEGWNPYQ
jgi:hypothetical protein